MSQYLKTSGSIVSLPTQQYPAWDRLTVDFVIADSLKEMEEDLEYCKTEQKLNNFAFTLPVTRSWLDDYMQDTARI